MDAAIKRADNPKAVITTATTSTTSTSSTTTTQQTKSTEAIDFFHPSLPTAFRITIDNKDQAKISLNHQALDGWRWISKDFIDDDDYDSKRGYFTDYKVVERDHKPDETIFKEVDVVLVKNKELGEEKSENTCFYIDRKKKVVTTTRTFLQHDFELQGHLNNESTNFDLPSNPVLKARQMPLLEVGDWVIAQGKTLRLVKASDQSAIANLEHHATLNVEGNTNHIVLEDFTCINGSYVEGSIEGVRLDSILFKNNYVRLAGAYVRRLERFHVLKRAFEQFFSFEKVQQRSAVRLAIRREEYDKYLKEKNDGSYYKEWNHKYNNYNYYRKCGDYTWHYKVTLSKKNLSENDLKLLESALGINLDRKKINASSTLENTVPFKKVLEILTVYNKDYKGPQHGHGPLLVSFPIAPVRQVEFLLNPQPDNNSSQLILSREEKNKKGTYTGHAYTQWLKMRDLSNNYDASINTPDASTADFILNNTLAEGKAKITGWNIEKIQNLIEFLVCTQVVEAHATPGSLEKSRVPGAGKHARSIIRKAKDLGRPLSAYFHSNNLKTAKEFYPMAAIGGTSNGRNAVNTLNRTNREVITKQRDENKVVVRSFQKLLERNTNNNAPDYDMSDDSDVDF